MLSKEKLDLLQEKRSAIELGGGQKRIDKQHSSGKLTARERLNRLFDENIKLSDAKVGTLWEIKREWITNITEDF